MCHRERATTEVATQNRKRRHSGMPLPLPDGAIGEANSGRVREVDRVKKRGARCDQAWSGSLLGGYLDYPKIIEG